MATSIHLDTFLEIKKINMINHLRNVYGLNVSENGSIRCPFHDDNTPSLNMNNKEGVWLFYCHGCGENGSLIDFVMKYENVDQETAVQIIQNNVNLMPTKTIKKQLNENKKKIPKKSKAENLGYLYSKLKKVKAYEYLFKRGLTKEVLDEYKIGYIDGEIKK